LLDALRAQWRFALKVISLNVRLPVAQLARFSALIRARLRERERERGEKDEEELDAGLLDDMVSPSFLLTAIRQFVIFDRGSSRNLRKILSKPNRLARSFQKRFGGKTNASPDRESYLRLDQRRAFIITRYN